MKPFICRIGTKKDIATKLINLFPEHLLYVEPFIGGGAIFFKKEPSLIEVINDLDGDVYNTYRTIKKSSLTKDDFRKDLNNLEAIKEFFDKPVETVADYLTRQRIKYCNGFGSNPVIKSKFIYQKSNPYLVLKDIEKYEKRLENVKIHNQSYEKTINDYDSEDTFFYLDPPYMDSIKLYKHGDFDFEKLARKLRNIKGKFLLSINDNPYIRDVFFGFNAETIVIKSKNQKGIGSKDRPELLISNY